MAEALTAQDADRLDELAAVLAWHWERAGRHLEAARWNMRAGGWALRSDLAEARRRWRTVVDLLSKAEESPESLKIGVGARIRLMQFGARTGIAPDELERLFTEGRALAERLGDRRLLVSTVQVSGTPMLMAGDFGGARARYLEAARLAEGADDPALQAALGVPFGLLPIYTGPLSAGLEWTDRTLMLCAGDVELGTEVLGYSVLALVLTWQSRLLARAGRLVDAHTALERALALARPRAEPDTLAWTLACFPQLAWFAGDGDDLLAPASEAVSIAEDTGNVAARVLAEKALALAHLAAGQPGDAAAACERALTQAREHRSGRFEEAAVLAHLARARLATNDAAGAVDAVDEAVAVARRQGARVVECLALLTRAQVKRAADGPDATDTILADLDAALALVQETGALTYEPFIREELGRLHSDEGELREALRLYTAIGATGHARRLGTELNGSPQGTPAPQRGG